MVEWAPEGLAMSDTETRWLDPEAAARYLSVRSAALPRLVRERRIPAPNYILGDRTPRWDRLALDAAFDGGGSSTDADTATKAALDAIIKKGRSRRQAQAGRRHDQDIPIR